MGTDRGGYPQVVIAYRDMGSPERRASLQLVHRWWTDRGFPVHVEAGDSDASFTRASAINAAVRATTADVIVQCDPDSLVPDLARIRQAVNLARYRPGLVVPHTRYLYLTANVTAAVLADSRLLPTLGPGDCDEHGRMGAGNVVVFSRQTWEVAGGFDERFGLWGGDDGAFAVACAGFCGPTRRRPGDMVHLWHPRLPQSVPGHPDYAAQFALAAEYRDVAALGPAMVREYVGQRIQRAKAGSW